MLLGKRHRFNDLPHPATITGATEVCQPTDSFSTVVTKWGIRLARALEHAHGRNILHCDVKPGNVLLFPDLSASLLDFNLASTEGESIRWAGGTLPYMASEQLHFLVETFRAGSVPECLPQVSGLTDVFGLSATLWYMATGAPPFGAVPECETRSQAAAILSKRQQAGVTAERIAAAEKVLPRQTVTLLLQGLSYAAEDRPPGITDFVDQLTACLPTVVAEPQPLTKSVSWMLLTTC